MAQFLLGVEPLFVDDLSLTRRAQSCEALTIDCPSPKFPRTHPDVSDYHPIQYQAAYSVY